MLNLMYITNRPEIAKIAISCGVQRIFIDMEVIGKADRQGGMDTVQCSHTVDDVIRMRKELPDATILVRCNPIHEGVVGFPNSKEEIDDIVSAGADIIMLPYFKTKKEVETFVSMVNGRAKTILLFETVDSVNDIDEILKVDGVDEYFIGLNDLSLGMRKKFMFEILADGTVEGICEKLKSTGKPYGFGGIASVGRGELRSEKIIAEHYRLGSTSAILSRSFCNTNVIQDLDIVKIVFENGLKGIREVEDRYQNGEIDFEKNRKELILDVERILKSVI